MKAKVLIIIAAVLLLIIAISLSYYLAGTDLEVEAYLDMQLQSLYHNYHDPQLLKMLAAANIDTTTLSAAYYQSLSQEAEFFLNDYGRVYYQLLSSQTQNYSQNVFGQIYQNIKYQIGNSYKQDDNYYLTLTIYPIDTVKANITADYMLFLANQVYSQKELKANQREEIFSLSLLNTLASSLKNPAYLAPIELEVEITDHHNYYQISNDSLTDIDALLIGY